MEEYFKLLESKKRTAVTSGFDVKADWPHLFPFQQYCTKEALKHGRFALFEDCGLGKTRQQITFADECVKHTGLPALILTHLAVVGQSIEEGEKIGIPLTEFSGEFSTGIYIANYEELDNIPCDKFSCVVLDESSILKNFEGATRNALIEAFKDTPYKLCCTATPAPNDATELGNHSEFLGDMTRLEMLAMYFVHDGGDTSKWRLKGHAKKAFYSWVRSWAIMVSLPSDIGFSDDGYMLPGLNYVEIPIKTPQKDNGKLFNDVSVNATNYNAELRETAELRLNAVAKIVNNSADNFIIWIKHNEEGITLKKLIPDAVEVKGSDKDSYKRDTLLGFANNEFRVLITKTKIASFGMNYQNCANQIYAAPDFSFEQLYQGVRRSYRFGQVKDVNIYLPVVDTMSNVIQSLKTKDKNDKMMREEMQTAMNEANCKETYVSDTEIFTTDNAMLMRGDCVQRIKEIPDNSVGISIFSPPFAELYTYSDKLEDMGNSKDYKQFLIAFGFMVRELFRIVQSGRNVVVHCMDLPIQKGKEGYIGLRDFSGMLLQAFNEAGFIYHSRVTIWKNPVTEMQRTKALGLLHKQIKKDASMSRVGIPDYLLVFRKPGEHLNPVIHQDKDPSGANYLPVDLWQQYASPVWMDIDYGDTLNVREGRDEADEKHICPLQLPTIRRALHLWSNECDTVFTPFMGIGSEVVTAVEMGRYGVGIELKDKYYDTAISNVKKIEAKAKIPKLFS